MRKFDTQPPYFLSEVRDDRYRTTAGPVLDLTHDGHHLRIDGTEGGWLCRFDDEQWQVTTVVELSEWLSQAAERWTPPEVTQPYASFGKVQVTTALDRGMASDLLFWTAYLRISPIINGRLYDGWIGDAPACTWDAEELGAPTWEIPGGGSPAASYGSVPVKRVGSRVFQHDYDTGISEMGFWDHNDEEFLAQVEAELAASGLVPEDEGYGYDEDGDYEEEDEEADYDGDDGQHGDDRDDGVDGEDVKG